MIGPDIQSCSDNSCLSSAGVILCCHADKAGKAGQMKQLKADNAAQCQRDRQAKQAAAGKAMLAPAQAPAGVAILSLLGPVKGSPGHGCSIKHLVLDDCNSTVLRCSIHLVTAAAKWFQQCCTMKAQITLPVLLQHCPVQQKAQHRAQQQSTTNKSNTVAILHTSCRPLVYLDLLLMTSLTQAWVLL